MTQVRSVKAANNGDGKTQRRKDAENKNDLVSTSIMFGNWLDSARQPRKRCHLPFRGNEIPLDHSLGPRTSSYFCAW